MKEYMEKFFIHKTNVQHNNYNIIPGETIKRPLEGSTPKQNLANAIYISIHIWLFANMQTFHY